MYKVYCTFDWRTDYNIQYYFSINYELISLYKCKDVLNNVK